MKQILGLFILLSALSAQANDCLIQSDVTTFFKTYKVRAWSDQNNQWIDQTTVDLCNDTLPTYRLIKAVVFLGSLKPEANNKKSSSIVTQEGAANYLQKRIGTFLLETKNHSDTCQFQGVGGYVETRKKDHTMHLCPDLTSGNRTLLDRTLILVHEARHVDNFPHVICNHGIYKKMDTGKIGACDSTYEEQGSYGVETSFASDIYRQTKNDFLKRLTRSAIVENLVQRFNQYPLDIQAGAAVLAQNDQVSFYNGQTKQKLNAILGAHSVMSKSDPDLIFYSAQTQQGGDYRVEPDLKPIRSPVSKMYSLHLTASEKSEVLDFEYGDDFACFLLRKKISCIVYPELYVDIPIDSFTPRNFLRTLSSSIIEGETTYIVSDQGTLYSLGHDAADLKSFIDDRQFKISKVPAGNLLSLGLWDEGPSEIAVNTQGQLLMYSPVQRQWSKVAPYSNETVRKVVSPYYWSKKLEDL